MTMQSRDSVQEERPSRLARLARAATTLGILAAVTGGLGAIARTSEPYGSSTDPGVPPLAVVTRRVELDPGYQVAREFVGTVEARRESRVGFELGGMVSAVLVDEGDHVDEGAILARLDTRILDAERAVLVAAVEQARAALELAALTRARVGEALERDAVSARTWDEADKDHQSRAAALARSEAALAALDARLAKTELRAPFPALVAERFLDEAEVVEAGTPILHVLERVEPEARIGVAGDSIDAVTVGDRFELAVRDRLVAAEVRSVLPVRGNGTRSVDVVLTLEAEFDGIRQGDLATLTVRHTNSEPGYWLPLTALTESSRGLWAAFVAEPLDEPPVVDRVEAAGTHRVRRRELEVLHLDGERAFVRGTFRDGELAITEGLQRIVPDQVVRLAGSASLEGVQ